jgi:hypothetical protein
MNLVDVRDGLKNKTIKIKDSKHHFNDILTSIEHQVDHYLDWLKELQTQGGNWIGYDKKPVGKERANGLIQMINLNLYAELEFGRYLHNVEAQCFNCDARMYAVLMDEKTIMLIDSHLYWKLADKSGKKYEFILTKKMIPNCEAHNLMKAKVLKSEIEVPTGKLLFTNFFQKDEIYEMKEEHERQSICSIIGRDKLMQYLGKKNIGYGQMGNMSVAVFVKDTGDEIIIGNCWGYTPEKGEYDVTFEGFKNLGNISLSVWRWMCGDLKILEQHGEKVPKSIKVNKCVEVDYKDYILTDVKPGRWAIEHYFDFFRQGTKSDIFSKLYLKK